MMQDICHTNFLSSAAHTDKRKSWTPQNVIVIIIIIIIISSSSSSSSVGQDSSVGIATG
jgi:hypothetical protein